MKRKGEKRREIRVILEHARIDVHTKKVQTQRELRGRVFDISVGGARFISEKSYEVKSEVYLSLLLPNGVSLSDISAKVVRCEPEIGNYYVAVEFKDVDNYQQSLIDDYIRAMKLWDENVKKTF